MNEYNDIEKSEDIENTAPPKEWSRAEKILLPASLLVALLFDRLVITQVFPLIPRLFDRGLNNLAFHFAIFWLCYLVIFYLLYWKRVKNDRVLWFTAACTVALCVWNFVFPVGCCHIRSNNEFRIITMLVIPGVLMAHAGWAAGGFTLKNSDGMAAAWLHGWAVKPFSGLPAWVGVSGSLLSRANKSTARRVLIGVLFSALLLLVIIPLLMGADRVFGYYLGRLFALGNFTAFFWHTVAVIIAFGLFFSFLWNIGFGERKQRGFSVNWSIDLIISAIVLGSVVLVYVLFCVVQFTYLFAGAGLPAGMTFSEYAREGFAQTVVVCAINLLLFGVFLRFGKTGSLLKPLLSGLLVLTGVMLFSGAVRLNLYIDAFGMTWLRLLSAWFILYLAAVIILCAVRLLFKKQLPLTALCALLLLLWYTALGFLNPDGFIGWYNAMFVAA